MSSVTYPASRGATANAAPASRAIALWLLFCCGMVFAMAVIGAITRLTESGLSMVEWKPLIGMLPPLSEAEWNRVFGLYQATPEYRYINAGMSLDEFKHIFFWEWFHRLWGQLIGFAFLLPFLWFWATKRIPKGLMPKLLGLFLLGGLQGGIGWFMVVSGLVDRPSVSHYRLALHLGVAFTIFGLMLWVALGLLDPKPESGRSGAAPALRRHAGLALGLVAVTVAWGAFVAGLDAGMIYNTWPLMGGHLVPEDMWFLDPAALNFVENHAGVQFTHRWLAIADRHRGAGPVVARYPRGPEPARSPDRSCDRRHDGASDSAWHRDPAERRRHSAGGGPSGGRARPDRVAGLAAPRGQGGRLTVA